MTDRRRTSLSADNDDELAAFHAEVARSASLSQEAFAALDPDALAPPVASIRASSSEVSSS